MPLQTRHPTPGRRPALSGVSLLVLVAFALGASVARADASLVRPDGSPARAVLVESTAQPFAARPQRKQEERPSAVAGPARVRAESGDSPEAPDGEQTGMNLPCLRESLVALPPPAAPVRR